MGLGTVVFTLLGGPVMQVVFRLVHFDVKAVHHDTFKDTLRQCIPKKGPEPGRP